MSRKSSNRGITLIALVVSIIVLLILAGISISMLSVDNGLLTRTVESKEETRGGAVQEQRDLWLLEKTSDNYTESQTATSLANLLEDLGPNGQKLLTAEEIDKINETGQVKIGSRTIVFKEILTIGSEYDKGHIKIGDKLSYSANGVNDWIVFGKDDDGNVLLATETPVDSFSPTYNAQHWFTWEDDLNNACSIYGGALQEKNITSRSIKMKDINNVVGFEEPTFKTYKFTTDAESSGQFTNGKINYYYPSLDAASNNQFPYLQKATTTLLTAIEGSSDIPAKEFVCNAYNYKYNADSDEYQLSWEGENSNWSSEKIDLTKNLKKVENMKYVVGELNSYMRYYIASCSMDVRTGFAGFYGNYVDSGLIGRGSANFCGVTSSGGGSGGGPSGWGLRPIVELPSDIEVKEISPGVYDIK